MLGWPVSTSKQIVGGRLRFEKYHKPDIEKILVTFDKGEIKFKRPTSSSKLNVLSKKPITILPWYNCSLLHEN